MSTFVSRLRKPLLAVAVAAAALTVSATQPATQAHATTASAPRSAAIPNCGPTVYKSAGKAWRCTFDDEFTGTSLNRAKWVPQTTSGSGFHSGPECYLDSPRNITISHGTLKLTARREAKPFTCTDPLGNYTTQYTSGMVSTYGLFSQAYGRFSIRAKFPATRIAGLQSALWMWPTDPLRYGYPWPRSGEIDIAEEYSQYADRAIPTLHYVLNPNTINTKTHTNVYQNDYCLIRNVNAFHTYTLVWQPGTLTVQYDGHTCLTDHPHAAAPLTGDQPFDKPFMLALTQALGIGTNAFNPAKTPLPATTEIEYVRAWK